MTLVILAAGMGSRFGGVKQMEPIDKDGNFIIDYSVFDAKRAGFDKVVFIIKEAIAADFKATIGARVEKHIAVEYAYQELSDIPEGYAVPEGRIKPWTLCMGLYCFKKITRASGAFSLKKEAMVCRLVATSSRTVFMRAAKAGSFCRASYCSGVTLAKIATAWAKSETCWPESI